MKNVFVLFILMFIHAFVYGQTSSGLIKDLETNELLEFVSIGIVGKDIGTVSDNIGRYSISINDNIYDNDTIKFSLIGYSPLSIKVSDYKNLISNDIFLKRQNIELCEIIVRPVITEDKILGNKFSSKKIQGGFKENSKGFECGVLLKIKKRAFLEELICNISECTYDSILYRLNVYQDNGNSSFVNILQEPIYVSKKIEKKQTVLTVDLSQYNITVEGNTLITLEHIADMGEGRLFFSGGLIGSTCYFRKKSHSNWNKTPIKLGFSVRAQMEK